jgi:hypothetical protein
MSANSGLTDDDLARIRAAAQDDEYNMAYLLSDDPRRAGRVEDPVPVRICALVRCMRAFAHTNRRIADEIDAGYARETIARHTRGDCTCDTPVPPTVCRTVGNSVEVDRERTREKRREWRDERGERE